jgi:hypothetical protein
MEEEVDPKIAELRQRVMDVCGRYKTDVVLCVMMEMVIYAIVRTVPNAVEAGKMLDAIKKQLDPMLAHYADRYWSDRWPERGRG